MPVTISDVARRAGVAEKTVSRVINNEPHVRPVMRARVEAAIAELGFVPNRAAQQLRYNRTFMIAMAIGSMSSDVIGPAVITTSRATASKGYTLILVVFDPQDPASLMGVANLAWRKQADGVILASPLAGVGVHLGQLLPKGFPWVHIGGLDTPPGVPTITADDQSGAYAMTEHLLESGHRRIGYVSISRLPFADRSKGFEAALAGHGLAVDPRYLIMSEDLTFEGGLSAGRRLLALDPRPTAICAANDITAAGVIKAAEEAGLQVPQSLSVTGFDDFPIAQITRPALTTVRVPVDEMSQAASDMLIDLINGRQPQDLRVRVPLSPVIRQSTGPCPESFA